MSQNSTSGPGPLRGLRVLELAQNLAGPYCGQILGDLGADVIKVERPGGDAARAWGPPFVDGTGTIFAAANRGKRSIELDLGDDDGRRILRALIERSDILIEAFRPGTFAAMGFDYDRVREWNAGLIYCSVLAYGEDGPLRDLPGYDPLMQAHGGLMSITGEPGTRGARVGTSVIDMGTGMWLVIAIMAALRERDATGAGTRLSTALFDTALAWNSYHIAGCIDTGFVPGPMGSELPMIAPYGAFATADGEIMIAAGNDGLFGRLCDALSLEELSGDDRFSSNAARVAHRKEVNDAVRDRTRTMTTADLLVRLRNHGVPCAPIQDIAEVCVDEQTAASGMIARSDGITAVRLPVRFDGVRPEAGTPPPHAGEHTAAVLAELGLD
ncbi:MAG TPA: CoA transferase [Longimicrobiales bacterium]|nr:CoA transferase [Longimicrobiales bacterium]